MNDDVATGDNPAGDSSGDSISSEASRALEAIIMVADQPADPGLLAQLVELSPVRVEEILSGLAEAYESEGRGFRLVKVAGGWRYQSHEDLDVYVERYVITGQSARLSAAALETLAIVAYKQPISRAQIAAIRGVSVDGVMRTLQQRGYIDEVAKDPGPGQASLFGTTSSFLEKLGLNSLSELPSLGDFIPDIDILEKLEQGLRFEVDESPSDVEGAPNADVATGTDSEPGVVGDSDAAADGARGDASAGAADAPSDHVSIDLTDGASTGQSPESVGDSTPDATDE